MAAPDQRETRAGVSGEKQVPGTPGREQAPLEAVLEQPTRQVEALQARLQETENELAAIYEHAPLAMMLVDGDCRVRKANEFVSVFSSSGSVRGKSLGTVMQCLDALKNPQGCGFGAHCGSCVVRRSVLETLQTGRRHDQIETGVPVVVAGLERSATFLLSTARLNLQGKPHVLLTLQDITEREQAEKRIRQLLRAQAILASVDHAIVRFQDRQQLLDEICRVAVQQGGFKLAWIGMVRPGGVIEPVAQAGETEYLQGIRVVVRDEPEGRGPVGTAIRENRPVIIEDVEHDPRMTPWRDRAQHFGLHYVAAFPIQVAKRVVGSFQFYAPSAGFFDESELQLLKQVSDDISFALTAIDAITERKRAEQELRRSEQELADFFAASPLGLLWVGPDGRILRVNRAELELLGRSSNEVQGHLISEFHVEPEVAMDVLTKVARKMTVQNYRARVRQKNGSIKHILIDANGFWANEQLVHSRWFVRDITHRVELEREILNISEREQRRLGHDLHDDLCQQLAGIEFLSQTLARELAAKSALEADHAGEIAQLVQQAMGQTRELARGLSPIGIGAEGLSEGLRQLAVRTSKIFRLDCQFRCPKPLAVPDHAVSIHLYRIAQEAVHNAIKHGKAKRIEIMLMATNDRLSLGVSDNGIGLPRKLPKPGGMGLRVMRYRAGVIGGSLLVQRLNKGGTTVICTVNKGLLPPSVRDSP